MGIWIPRDVLLRGSGLIVAGYIPEDLAERDTVDNWPAFTLDTTRELAPYIEAHHDCIILEPGESHIENVFEINHPGLRFFTDRMEIETETGKLVVYDLGLRHWYEIGESA